MSLTLKKPLSVSNESVIRSKIDLITSKLKGSSNSKDRTHNIKQLAILEEALDIIINNKGKSLTTKRISIPKEMKTKRNSGRSNSGSKNSSGRNNSGRGSSGRSNSGRSNTNNTNNNIPEEIVNSNNSNGPFTHSLVNLKGFSKVASRKPIHHIARKKHT